MDNLLAQEMAKKYNHTVAQIIIKKTGELRAVYFEGFALDTDIPYCVIHYNAIQQSKQERIIGIGDVKAEKIPLINFEILPMPDKQVFDYGGRTLVYTRVPNRQWRKGLYRDNTFLEDPMYNIISEIPNRNNFKLNLNHLDRYGVKILHNLYVQEYAGSLEKAVNDIAEFSLLSRTINSVYWLGCFLDDDKPYILYRHAIPVAFYNNKIDTLTCISKVYLQEITDFCNRFNLTAKVEV